MLIQDPPVKVVDDLFMLGTSAYPIYLLRGDGEAALVEGGVGPMAPLVVEQMDRLGIGRDLVKQLLVTHAHPDHVMAVPRLRALFPGIRVVASEIAAKTLAAEKAIAFFAKIDEALTGALLESGRIEPSHRPKPLAENRIAVDHTVKEGDAIAVGRFSLRVLETPGHSECSLSFHEPNEKILFISDATGYYLPEHESWWPNYFSGYREYIESMARLSGLHAEVLCLSHNAAVRGLDAVHWYFRGAIAATKKYHARIVQEAKSGKGVRELAQLLGAEIHEKAPLLPLDFFEKNCALLVKQSLKYEDISPRE
jgi:glyoxylase-like metal-dependent hydrolase (beta-lactamase superfamily II)